MALIFDAMRHPLDPLYADVAHQRALQEKAGSARSSRPMGVVLAVIMLVVGIGVGASVSALKVPKKVAVDARTQLVREVQTRQSANDETTRSITSLRTQIKTDRGQALDSPGEKPLKDQLARGEAAAGLSEVSGPGMEVTVSESSNAGGSADSDPRTAGDVKSITSSDLQRVINGLWQAGASGIAINDQRLTSLSAIRFAGSAILVNYRPLTLPYVVRATGPKTLNSSFARTDGARYLETLHRGGFGVDVREKSTVRLPSGAAAPVNHAQVNP